MQNERLEKRQSILVVLLIVLLGSIFHYAYINEFPSFIHAWTQSDRYALALGFVNNDLNFFKPETYSLLKNCSDINDWKYPTKESITAVNFPIHDYLPALAMKVLGNTSPWIFRLYILLYSFVGLFYVYRLALLWTKDFSRSIFITAFLATSPVFVYYQGGFLPSIPSLANAIIGVYYYSQFLLSRRDRDYNLGILFFVLAGLARTTFLIPLIAVLCVEFLRLIQRKSKFLPKLLPTVLAIGIIGFYFRYNTYLAEKYGAIFLNVLLPAKSFEHAVEILQSTFLNWGDSYYSLPQYVIFGVAILLGLYFRLYKREQLGRVESDFFLLVGVLFLGCFAFAILMLQQFVAHDYYFIDTFYLPCILLLIVLLSVVPNAKNQVVEWGIKALMLNFLLLFSLYAIKSQSERRITGHWDKTAKATEDFQGAEAFLDSLEISSDAKLLVLDASTSNIPFILMNRKGYPLIRTRTEFIEKSLSWDFDYIVVQNEMFLSSIYNVYPLITSQIKKIADNGRISVFEKTNIVEEPSLVNFLGLDTISPSFSTILPNDTVNNTSWSNFSFSNTYKHSDEQSYLLQKDQMYGCTFKSTDLDVLTLKSNTLFFNSYFLKPSSIDVDIVVSIIENGQSVFYTSTPLGDLIKSEDNWENVSLVFQLPQVKSDDYEFAFYLYNKSHSKLYANGLGFSLY